MSIFDKDSFKQKIMSSIQNISQPKQHLRECEALLINENLADAISQIKQDNDLSKFISYANQFYLKLYNEPLFSNQGKQDGTISKILLDILRSYYVFCATPKQCKVLKLNPYNFRILQNYFIFDYYKITADKKNELIPFLPLIIAICEICLKNILINPKEFCDLLDFSHDALFEKMAGLNTFELLHDILQRWQMQESIIKISSEFVLCSRQEKSEYKDDFMLVKILFGFEFGRERLANTNLMQIFNFNDDYNQQSIENIKNLLGSGDENSL